MDQEAFQHFYEEGTHEHQRTLSVRRIGREGAGFTTADANGAGVSGVILIAGAGLTFTVAIGITGLTVSQRVNRT